MNVVTYYRVSTAGQSRSGLGLDAQREAVRVFCSQRGCEVLAEYVEIESGGKNDRVELEKALHRAEVTGATLVVSRMDRLSRNVAFLATLQDSGARFVAADMPEANELTIHILAAVAQAERKAISTRTKEALAAAKARGVALGNPRGAAALREAGKGNKAALEAIKARADRYATKLAREVSELREGEGCKSLRELAAGLNSKSIKTPRGGKWYAASVRALLSRLDRLEASK
ncbi:recombinase family protein [Sphingorhabdus sp. YGSMI21]|uniref:recombinase family protein n=1 Tax=Sphingorhabdus sp. YGSMI21 TaxID=2077182 RepID=UPI000C1EBDF7|nr:recombinase family protein [Sphingorhabdus sp. YGSMI21]ATW02457.1 resolvase [Sphingorhabdus sp. YGSMI21]